MQLTGEASWTADGDWTPVVGVVPVPPSTEPRHVTVEGLSHVQSEPWKVDATGRVHSYRVAGIATGGAVAGKVELVDGADEGASSFAFHEDMHALLAGQEQFGVSFSDVQNKGYWARLLQGGRDVVGGSAERSATYAAALKDGETGLPRTAFVAQVTTYHNTPWCVVDLLWHNADWENVVGDVVHNSLHLRVPKGFVVTGGQIVGKQLGKGVLPMQGGRRYRWYVHRDEVEPAFATDLLLKPDVDRLSWSNPICQGYLPQGLPVEADRQFASWKYSQIREAVGTGSAFDSWSLPSRNGLHTEGPHGGNAGSSYGVEKFGDVGLALHGHADGLMVWQAATLNRLPCLLLDSNGRGIDCDLYAEDDRLPWQHRVLPAGRGVYDGDWGRTKNWTRDPFGFTTAPTTDEDYAREIGHNMESLGAVLRYGPYDRQHWMRAIRATLPLAYICGDRFSVLLLQEHACSIRADFWEGDGSNQHDNRVGHYFREAKDSPGRGVALGREDAWCIQSVLAACELSGWKFAAKFGRWLRRYASTLKHGQIFRSAMVDPGLVQAKPFGKEANYVDGKYAQNQGYQEGQLAWAAGGLANYFGVPEESTAARQAEAVRYFHGDAPLYKISVRRESDGALIDKPASDMGWPYEDRVQSGYAPTLAMQAVYQVWAEPERRGELLDWCHSLLGLDPEDSLADWQPKSEAEERQSACVAPMAKWLRAHGLLS